MQAGHAHQFKEADGLECDRLAARVGTGDDDHVIIRAKLDIDRDNFFRIDQRMTALADINVIFVIKNRPGGILLHGEIRAGKNEIQLSHILGVVFQFHEMVAGFGGKSRQNLFNLFLFLQGKFAQLVVERDNGGRLYKECGTAGRLIVDESGDLGLVLGLDRNAVAVAAQGDHVVLQIGGIGAVDHLRELLVDLVSGQLHIPTHLAEGGGGIVCHLLLGEDATADFRRQGRDRIQAVKKIQRDIRLFLNGRRRENRQCCRLLFSGIGSRVFIAFFRIPALDLGTLPVLVQSVVTDSSDIVQKGEASCRSSGMDRGADRQGSEHIVEIPVVSEGDGTFPEEMGQRRFGLRLCMFYFKQIIHRSEFSAQLFARL